jgi:copper oxidase (laccase) domain-containing protein
MFLAARLRRLGVGPASIEVIGPCTASTAHLASYRRDGADSGRQWSLIFQGCSGGGPAGGGNLRPRS